MSNDVFNRIKDDYLNDIRKSLIEGIKYIEDSPLYPSVGRFSYPNEEGDLQLDACYMEGNNIVGAVIETKHIVNPIEVAKDLSNYNENIVLACEGADKYAKEKGFKLSDRLETANDITIDSHDIFGIITYLNKHFVCGISTSGRSNKRLGRVGDTPLVGSGLYCEDNVGACLCTGDGEAVLRNCVAKEVVDHMFHGLSVKEALILAGERAKKKMNYEAEFRMIAMDKDGEFYAYCSKDIFPFSILVDGKVKDYYVLNNEVKEVDDFFRNNYHGD